MDKSLYFRVQTDDFSPELIKNDIVRCVKTDTIQEDGLYIILPRNAAVLLRLRAGDTIQNADVMQVVELCSRVINR